MVSLAKALLQFSPDSGSKIIMKNRLIFMMKLKHTKEMVPFLGHPVHLPQFLQGEVKQSPKFDLVFDHSCIIAYDSPHSG